MSDKIKRFPRLPDSHDEMIQGLVSKLAKKYGKSENKGVTTLSESIFSEEEVFIPSGLLPLDCVTCFGKGFPVGIVEIYGPNSSGKSAILELTLAEAQRRGYFTGLFPMEYSVRIKRAIRAGIDPRKLVVFDAETIEDVYDQTKDFVKNARKEDPNTPIVLGWDTVAATPTRTELDNKKGLAGSDMGRFANQMSKLFRRLCRFLRKNNVLLICINQTRTNLAKLWGSKETTYGGAALGFYAWVRIRVTQEKIIKDKHDHEIGIMCSAYVKKNKVGRPFKKCHIPILWKLGIDKERAMWEYCTSLEVFTLKGTSYRWHGKLVRRRKFSKFYEKYQKKIDREIIEASQQDE